MSIDVTRPLEVVALKGADEPEGTCWDAEYVNTRVDGDIEVSSYAPFEVYYPSGRHFLGKPYRLRNKAKRASWRDDDALCERVVELTSFIVTHADAISIGKVNYCEEVVEKAKAILTAMQPPVDPLVEEIREQLGPKFKHLAPLVAKEYRNELTKEADNG